MKLDSVIAGDIEANGLLEEATKFHVFSWGSDQIQSTNDPKVIGEYFANPNNYVAIHNGQRFDVPLVEKLCGIKVKAVVVDTLALAWYLDLKRASYGLEGYGEEFGVPKPVISSWSDLTYDEYKNRCEEDVKITITLWRRLLGKLREIYDNDEDIIRLINYLNFIMQCSYHQERQKVLVDLHKVRNNLTTFTLMKDQKVEQLKLAMPRNPIKRKVSKPAQMYKKNGDLSEAGKKWLSYGIEGDSGEIIVSYEDANPNSTQQKKEWLYALGWEPQTFKYNRNKETGEVKKVEQIMTEEKTLCPSVLKLKDKEPAIEVLEGISVLSHRIGLLQWLLDNNKDGYVVQGLYQLAVTLRWQHSGIVNYPRVTSKGDIRDGKWIRECLIAGEGHKIVQSDLSGIESRTSDHYTFPLNPGLIAETQQKYFDPHIKIAIASNLMTQEEGTWYKWKKENKERKEKGLEELPLSEFGTISFVVDDEKALMTKLKLARDKAKTTNYASLYQVGANTLSRNLNIPKHEAQRLIDGYWRVHWAVKEVTKTFKIKKVGEELWVLNPISKFWHNLRNEKDAFSTVNQSSAVFCFNMWLAFITKEGYWPILQSHDDLMIRVKAGEEDKVKQVILKAMQKVNDKLKLNVALDCEVQIGNSADQTH